MITLPDDLFIDKKFVSKRYRSNYKENTLGIKYYDHFINPNGYEVIILPFYADNSIIEYLNMHGFITIKNLCGNEPCIFSYKNPISSDIQEIENKYTLSVMTMFYKETYDDLDIFYRYYIDQGADHFFMYYNGPLEEANNFPFKDNVTYIEWNYKYFIEHNSIDKHHAQIPAMVSFQKKYLPYYNYALLIDTDEFLYHPNHTIKDYLVNNNTENHLFTRHNWAKINFSDGIIDFINNNSRRGKTILCSKNFKIYDLPSVHRLKGAIDCDIDLFHNNKRQHNVRKHDKRIKIII